MICTKWYWYLYCSWWPGRVVDAILKDFLLVFCSHVNMFTVNVNLKELQPVLKARKTRVMQWTMDMCMHDEYSIHVPSASRGCHVKSVYTANCAALIEGRRRSRKVGGNRDFSITAASAVDRVVSTHNWTKY